LFCALAKEEGAVIYGLAVPAGSVNTKNNPLLQRFQWSAVRFAAAKGFADKMTSPDWDPENSE